MSRGLAGAAPLFEIGLGLPSKSCSNFDQSLLVFAAVSSYFVFTFTGYWAAAVSFLRCRLANSSYDCVVASSGVFLRLRLELFRLLLLEDLRRLVSQSLAWLFRRRRLAALDCR